eukprot:COSAG02_NODE_49263_length_328_cov_0.611354_1_plen_77_part_10
MADGTAKAIELVLVRGRYAHSSLHWDSTATPPGLHMAHLAGVPKSMTYLRYCNFRLLWAEISYPAVGSTISYLPLKL